MLQLTTTQHLLCVVCALLGNHVGESFVVPVGNSDARKGTGTLQRSLKSDNHETPNHHVDSPRRNFLLSSIGFPLWTTLLSPASVSARDELFRPNPLTNPVLEKIRIWEQAEADEIKYGGELAPGAPPKTRDIYAKLLVPIIVISNDLTEIARLTANMTTMDTSVLSQIQRLAAKPQFDKIFFKKTFNAFADNIYYTDPDRANLYLAGGATPKPTQSMAYLLRNDILNNVEALRAEVDYLLKSGDETTDDLKDYAAKAQQAMVRYIELVPPEEVKMANDLLMATS